MISFSALYLIDGQREYNSARSEYDQLRELRPAMFSDQSGFPFQQTLSEQEAEKYALFYPLVTNQSFSDFLEPDQPDPLAGLAEINRDFIGWIMIGDFIDYPVVRGRDNDRYLETTFSGQNNISGAIFMDHANTRGFDETVAVLYGHNMRNGTMFAPLHRYRDRTYLAENPNILILTAKGELLLYRIFAARITDVENRDADLGISNGSTASGVFRNAPAGTNRFLVLSTCTSVDDNERLRIYAALIE